MQTRDAREMQGRDGRKRGSPGGREGRKKAIFHALVAGLHGAFEHVSESAVFAGHAVMGGALRRVGCHGMVRTVRQAAHAVTGHRIHTCRAGERGERRREQREDDEDGLSAAHRQEGYHSFMDLEFVKARRGGRDFVARVCVQKGIGVGWRYRVAIQTDL